MSETRKLAAILVADVVRYSRLAGADEERTLARLRALRSDLIDPSIALHHGRVVKRTGDGLIIEFRSVVDAVRGAIEVQSGMIERNGGLPPEKRIEFRVGIHVGDVVEESDGDLMGDGVNIATRIEGVAKPGTICLSEQAPPLFQRHRPHALRSGGGVCVKCHLMIEGDLGQGPLPGLVIGATSRVERSGVSSFQRTDPIGRSNMRRIRIGSGPRWNSFARRCRARSDAVDRLRCLR